MPFGLICVAILFERCKETKTVEGSALGHEFTDYKVTKEATEGADGEQVAICNHGCGTKDTQIIHYYGEWEVTKEDRKSTRLNSSH